MTALYCERSFCACVRVHVCVGAYMCVCVCTPVSSSPCSGGSEEHQEDEEERGRLRKRRRVLPVDDHGVRGRLVAVSAAFLVTASAERRTETCQIMLSPQVLETHLIHPHRRQRVHTHLEGRLVQCLSCGRTTVGPQTLERLGFNRSHLHAHAHL